MHLFKGFYDRGKELNWKNMKDLQFVGAMGPPGGARNMLDPRFVSLFDVFEVQFPSNANLQTIYTSILAHHVASLPEDIRGIHTTAWPFTRQQARLLLPVCII